MKPVLGRILFSVLSSALVLFSLSRSPLPDTAELTVLMYHHFAEPGDYTIVTEARFREQLAALQQAGYETVTLQQLLAWVDGDTALPEKPLLITMDDGYTSNVTVAAPILEEFSMSAVVFAIGINEGQTIYAHSGNTLYPARFSYEEALPCVEKGVLDVQSHTYDLHQLASYGYSGREGMLQLDGESTEAYIQTILEDCRRFRENRTTEGLKDLVALAYPFGYYTPELDQILTDEFAITFTITEHMNTIRQGDPDSLRLLGRFNVPDNLSGEALVQKLDAAAQQHPDA